MDDALSSNIGLNMVILNTIRRLQRMCLLKPGQVTFDCHHHHHSLVTPFTLSVLYCIRCYFMLFCIILCYFVLFCNWKYFTIELSWFARLFDDDTNKEKSPRNGDFLMAEIHYNTTCITIRCDRRKAIDDRRQTTSRNSTLFFVNLLPKCSRSRNHCTFSIFSFNLLRFFLQSFISQSFPLNLVIFLR